MEWILVLCGATGIALSILVQRNSFKNVREDRRYTSYLATDILLYVSEICMMFGIFLFATENPVYTTQYRIAEDSLLKIFIDFFLVYQITLLITFKLIDGHFINSCQRLNRSISIARDVVQSQQSAGLYLETYKSLEHEFTYHFPIEIMYVFRETINDMELYEKRYQSYSLTDDTLNLYLRNLDNSKLFLDRLVEIRQDEWGVSILKRIKKSKKMNLIRKEFSENTSS